MLQPQELVTRKAMLGSPLRAQQLLWVQIKELGVLKTRNGELMEANLELQAKNVTLQQAAKSRHEDRDPLKVAGHFT